MKLETKLRAYELLIADLESKLEQSYKDIDKKSAEDIEVTGILMNEVLRLSNYKNLMTVAKRIDAEVFNGRCNYEVYVECNFDAEALV